MSTATIPISPSRFAEALKDLPLSTLHLKAAELRNSIAHLDYSNEQLKPFAEGTDPSSSTPDQDCIEAIQENEIVITRMQQRIELLKAEVEGRGQRWTEFISAEGMHATAAVEENKEGEGLINVTAEEQVRMVAETGGQGEARSSPWTNGTFQTGRIMNGEVRMDAGGADDGVAIRGGNENATSSNGTGRRLDDEALRRAMEERMRNLEQEEDDEDGMHL